MGSLMAGWSTKPSPAEEVFKRSNSSLTKDEVDKFWRTKRLMMQEHLDEANKDASESPKSKLAKAMADEIEAQQKTPEGLSLSMPAIATKPAWWTRSNWAFLNDPPTEEAKHAKYVPQFDVATKGQVAQDNFGKSAPLF